MSEDPRNEYRYRILRYTPNLIRDEWVNIGVFLEEIEKESGSGGHRRVVKLIEEQSELARVRRLHPNADEKLLRALPFEFDSRLRDAPDAIANYLQKLDQTLSNALQFSSPRSVLGDDFDIELDRLYRAHVALPRRARSGIMESTRAWIKQRINDVFLRRRVPKLQRNIRVDAFTEPGDTLRIDYGYQNGIRGFVHALALGRDPAQPKALAYTAHRIRLSLPHSEFTAITESELSAGDPRHQFVGRLFADEKIAIVPVPKLDRFAEDLRLRLQ